MFTIKGILAVAIAAIGYFAVGSGDVAQSAAGTAANGYYPNMSLPMLFKPMER